MNEQENSGATVSKCSSLELILNTFRRRSSQRARGHVPVTGGFHANPDLHVCSGHSEAVTDVTGRRQLEQAAFWDLVA